MILKGEGWCALDGSAPACFADGDILMFPRGDAHTLSSAPGMRAAGGDHSWRATMRDDPKPILVAFHDGVCEPGRALPAADASVLLV